MKLTGTAIMHAAPDRVWAALTDPAVLAAAIPGCDRLEPAGPDAYQFTIAAGLGSLHGAFTGRVAVSDRREPDSFVLTATGSGGPGTVSIRARFALTAGPDGSTELGYDADGEATGLLAAVGQRMFTAVAQRMTTEFFRSLDAQLQDGNEAAAGHSQPELAGPVPAGPVPAGPVPAGAVPLPRQPGSGPPAPPARAAAGKAEFLAGALAGTAAALAGVAIGSVVRRRKS